MAIRKSEVIKAKRVENHLRANYRTDDGYNFEVYNLPGHVAVNLQFLGHAMTATAQVKDDVFGVCQTLYGQIDKFCEPFYDDDDDEE